MTDKYIIVGGRAVRLTDHERTHAMAGTFHLLHSDGSGCTFHAANTLRAAIDQEQGEGQIMLIWSGEPSLADLRHVSEDVYDQALSKPAVPPALTVEMGGQVIALNPDAARGRPVKGGNIILAIKNVHNLIRLKTALDDLYRQMELKAKWLGVDGRGELGRPDTIVTCWECEQPTPYTHDGRCPRCRPM